MHVLPWQPQPHGFAVARGSKVCIIYEATWWDLHTIEKAPTTASIWPSNSDQRVNKDVFSVNSIGNHLKLRIDWSTHLTSKDCAHYTAPPPETLWDVSSKLWIVFNDIIIQWLLQMFHILYIHEFSLWLCRSILCKCTGFKEKKYGELCWFVTVKTRSKSCALQQ